MRATFSADAPKSFRVRGCDMPMSARLVRENVPDADTL